MMVNVSSRIRFFFPYCLKLFPPLLILSLLAFCLIVGQASLAQQKTDRDLNDLQGPIHIVRTTIYFTVKTGKTVKRGAQSEYTETYNRQGNLIEKQSTFGQSSAHQSMFQRDADGNRIEKSTILPVPPNPKLPPPPPPPMGSGGDGVLEFKTSFQYEPENKRLTATTHRKSGELLKTEVYRFDEQGRIAEYAQSDGPTIPFGSQSRRQDKRDAKGTLLESIYYDKDGKVTSRTRFQSRLDARGNWIRRTEITADATGKASDTTFTSVRAITYSDFILNVQENSIFH
jgi:hypothetical protein